MSDKIVHEMSYIRPDKPWVKSLSAKLESDCEKTMTSLVDKVFSEKGGSLTLKDGVSAALCFMSARRPQPQQDSQRNRDIEPIDKK